MSMDWVRNIHFIAAFTFCAAFILRIYGYIRYPGDRLFPRVWKGHFYRDTIDVALHYMLLKPGATTRTCAIRWHARRTSAST